MPAPVNELLLAEARTLEDAVRHAIADPAPHAVAELEELTRLALHSASAGRSEWEQAKAMLGKGMAAYFVRPLVVSCVDLGRRQEGILGRLLALATELKSLGVEFALAAELPAALGQSVLRRAEAAGVFEFLDRPREPLDREQLRLYREQLRLSRESFLRGEGRDVRDLLAERGWPGVS